MTGFTGELTLVAADSDLEISSLPGFDRPLRLAEGRSLTFVSADTLYIRPARDEPATSMEEVGRDG